MIRFFLIFLPLPLIKKKLSCCQLVPTAANDDEKTDKHVSDVTPAPSNLIEAEKFLLRTQFHQKIIISFAEVFFNNFGH